MTAAVLSVSKVSKSFGGVAAVSNVTFTAQAGHVLGIMGPNGAGKTTLFNAIAGMFSVDSGIMSVGDVVISGLPAWQRSRHGIARTFQIPRPIWSLTVRENVSVGLITRGRSREAALFEAERQLEELGLSELADVEPASLSTGQLRLLEFARVACLSPKVLLLDEVFAGLSHSERIATATAVRALRDKGICIIWIEHNVRLMMELAESIIVMDGGRIIASGKPSEIIANERVISIYLGSGRERKRTARHVAG